MKRLSIIGLIIGLTTITTLIVWQGGEIIAQIFTTIGLKILWLPVFFLIPLICANVSWFYLFPNRKEPSFRLGIYASWIGFGVNWLLPVAQIGGEITRMQLLAKRKYKLPILIASLVGDKTLQVATQAIFATLGFGLFIYNLGDSRLIVGILLGIFFLGGASFGFLRIQQQGMFKIFARFASKIIKNQDSLNLEADKIDTAIKQMYAKKRRLIIATIARLAFRFVLVGEIYLALHFLGYSLTFIEALILESLGQAVRAASFLIPSGLGAQEGSFIIFGGAFGLPPEIALTLSLCKRFRELVIGVPALICLQIDILKVKSSSTNLN